jgi:hypothetical protein
VRTLVGGITVHRDGEIVVPPGTGRFLSVHDEFAAVPAAAAAGAPA